MIVRPYWLCAALIPYALADVRFTRPAPGATQTGGGTLSVSWVDSGDSPSLDQLTSYQLFLVGGGNEDNNLMQLTLVANGDFSTGNSAEGTVTPAFGGSTRNAYYLKMVSVATQGGTVINYSERFTLSGMTGTFPPPIEAAITGLSGASDVPATQNNVASNNNANGASASIPEGSFSMAYTLQTGATKYAPMQSLAPTKITAKGPPPPRYPTSAFSIAASYLPTPLQVTTNTVSQTFSTSSIENTAAAAPMPTDTAMARFLERWKD